MEYKSSFRNSLTRPRHMVLVFSLHSHKGKVRPMMYHEGPEGEQRYSSTLSLASAPDDGARLTPRSGSFNPRMTRYPVHRRLGGPQGRSGRVQISSPPKFNTRTVQAIATIPTTLSRPTIYTLIHYKINPQATDVIYIYIYMEHPFLMFLDHTQRRSTVGRTPLDE